jgi:PilZ domain-containing protein
LFVFDSPQDLSFVLKCSTALERQLLPFLVRGGINVQKTGVRGKKMTERRTARRYDLSLPVMIRVPIDKEISSRSGKTRDISTRGVYFTIDQDLGAGAELDITLTLPAEVTRGSEVFIRAMGKVVRVDKKPENNSARIGVAAVIERYEIIRTEPPTQ